MTDLSGSLIDVGADSLMGRHPRLVFKPSEPFVTLDGFLVATAERFVTPDDTTGSWVTALIPNEGGRPHFYYSMSIEWLDPTMGMSRKDFPQWRLYMPNRDCNITELLGLPANPLQAWVDSSTPPNSPVAGAGWMDENGLYYEYEG